tara:strand:+ start:93 stop:608 length:516 start_codon:yes stop_codon:yes gene_type:complete
MAPRYLIAFVPHLKHRKKVSPLRAIACRKTHSTQALQCPVHFSLTKTTTLKNYNSFEEELLQLCSNEKKQNLKFKKYTDVLPDRFWSGISIIASKELIRLHKKLEELINKYAVEKRYMRFTPHITLTFPAKVASLEKMKVPFNSLKMDRVTILKQDEEGAPYRIHKHIKLA